MADKKISALTAATTPLAGSEVLPIVQGGSTVKVSVDNLTTGKAVYAGSVLVNIPSTVQKITVDGGLTAADAADCGIAILRAGITYGTNLYHTYSTSLSSDAFGITVNDNTTLTNPLYTKYLVGSNGVQIWYGATTATELGRFDTSGNLKATVGNFVVGTAGKGIDFSANTHAPGMTSELLNDYEEGTFTLTDSGVKDAVLGTWTFVSGTYTKIGRQVTINAIFSGTGLGFSANTGYYRWDGLPYASASVHSGTWQGIEAFKACAGFAFTAGSNIWLHAAITTQTSDSGIVLTATYTV